tara:strand:- start:14798 stop:16303 length:1506 start_codon:yes stop_codon:yes gene_type:complete
MEERFNSLFSGLKRAHGTYEIKDSRVDGKLTGKAVTVREAVTMAHWKNHLNGTKGLGIIPINDDSNVKFGAIDVDEYKDLDLVALATRLKDLDLPLVPCRSKSGGVHLYLFCREWVPAKLMKHKLEEISAALGFGGSEVFPKQIQILAERGDVGGWINMPYFNSDDSKRYAISGEGAKLKAVKFLDIAESLRLGLKELKSLKVKSNDSLNEAPPCLQYLTQQGFPEGTRNNGLFNMAVYARKAFPDNWQVKVEGYNIKFMDPPLISTEVLEVIKSANKKTYQYTCSRAPIAPHCNSSVCKLRKHGIGNDGGMPAIHSLTKYNSNPPIWFLDVEGSGRIELETDDLQNQRRFQKRCMEKLNMMPTKMNENSWNQLINHLFENLNIIEAPVDASSIGQLFELLERFCTNRAQALSKDEILLGKPWTDDKAHYFRISDLMAFFDRQHFREFKVHQVTSLLKQKGASHHFWNVKGKGVNLWSIPLFDKQEETLDVPEEVKDDLSF